MHTRESGGGVSFRGAVSVHGAARSLSAVLGCWLPAAGSLSAGSGVKLVDADAGEVPGKVLCSALRHSLKGALLLCFFL